MTSIVSESEHVVYVNFDSILDNQLLKAQPVILKMIGIDTEKPAMQIGNQVYLGEYRDTVGTALFFEEDKNPHIEDPIFTKLSEKNLKYACKTRKNLSMIRVFAKEKTAENEKVPEKVNKDVDETQEEIQRNSEKTLAANDCTEEKNQNTDNISVIIDENADTVK